MQNTASDKMVDENSINPGFQMFEKRVSGMFLGEILRYTLVSLTEQAQLFNGSSSPILCKQYGIDTASMSTIAADISPHLDNVKTVIIEDFGIPSPSADDCRAVKLVSDAIARRSARLAACAVSAVCDFSGRYERAREGKPVDVGADGSLVEFYPRYVEMCLEGCEEILGDDASKRIRIELAKDGSGVGAALYVPPPPSIPPLQLLDRPFPASFCFRFSSRFGEVILIPG
jgi:hexokinase